MNYTQIRLATERIKNYATLTPIMTSRWLNQSIDAQLFFKCENFQRTGSFKFRGALNAILQLDENEKKRGVLAFSSGNHGQAIALAASMFGIKATVVMPHDAPSIKIEATRFYGAEVILYDREREDRNAISKALVDGKGLTFISPFDDYNVIAGQGTAAKELFDQCGELDFLFIPIGGGGLVSGSAIAAQELAPKCKIIGVEPESGNDTQISLRLGQRVSIPLPKTIADGAQTLQVGEKTFPIIQRYVSDIQVVSDRELKTQMRFFLERMKMVVEPTACLAAAAAIQSSKAIYGKKVGVILSGGNVDLNTLQEI